MTESLPRRAAAILEDWLSGPREAGPEALALAGDIVAGADDWQRLLADSDAPEASMLVELLLFPDGTLRRAMEPLLAEGEWGEADLRALAGRLRGTRCRFSLPDGGCFELTADEVELLTLLGRLRPARRTPQMLLDVLAGLPETVAPDAAVRLRLSRFAWNPKAEFCVRTLCLRLGRDGEFPELLDFLCLFLESHADEADLAAAMLARREAAERHLKNHLAFMERLERSNFETMHLSGDRAAHADPEVLRREMALMDRLCPALFGREVAPAVSERDLGHIDGEDGVGAMFDLLDGD